MKFDNQTYRISGASNIGQRLLLAGIAGLILSGVGLFFDSRQFFHSYLVAFTFWVSVGLGGLFFTMLHHLVSASWSVVLRRMFENVMIALPLLFIFFIPIAFGMGNLYEWTDADKVAVDHLLQGKAGYLNSGFFLARTLIYFAIWSIIAFLAYKLSLRQDQAHSEALTAKMKKVSAPGMILLAVTLTFAAWDWLMSLDAHWYSTIFGAYYFAGSALSALAVVTLIAIYLRSKQVLVRQITPEHYHDLAKLLFAFTVFWAYMAFSQYFLIWYANIPEETIWFQHRWAGSWKAISFASRFRALRSPVSGSNFEGGKTEYARVGICGIVVAADALDGLALAGYAQSASARISTVLDGPNDRRRNRRSVSGVCVEASVRATAGASQ